MFKKILTFGLALIVGVTALGTSIFASPRAFYEVSTNAGYGYGYYTTNQNYQMITNGNDGDIWIKVGPDSEGKLYQYEKAVKNLRDTEDHLIDDGLSYPDLYKILGYLMENDLSKVTTVLLKIYETLDMADKEAKDAKQRLDVVVEWYEALLPYEAPESKNECVWNGGSWICKFMEGAIE